MDLTSGLECTPKEHAGEKWMKAEGRSLKMNKNKGFRTLGLFKQDHLQGFVTKDFRLLIFILGAPISYYPKGAGAEGRAKLENLHLAQLFALRVAWLVLTQRIQEMSSVNLNLNLQACL